MEQNHVHHEQQLFAGFKTAFESFATEAIHVGQEPEQWKSMAVVPPISLSTTFKQEEPGKHAVSGPVIWGYRRPEMTTHRTHVLACANQEVFVFSRITKLIVWFSTDSRRNASCPAALIE